jgi:integrase
MRTETCGKRDGSVRRARFHDLRHFSLTMAAVAGASTKELMRRGGHSTPAAALRYQHATENRDKVIADAMGELLKADVLPIDGARKGKA